MKPDLPLPAPIDATMVAAADGTRGAGAVDEGGATTPATIDAPPAALTAAQGGVATARQLAARLLRSFCHAAIALLDGANLAQLLLFLHGQARHATLAQRLLDFTLRRARPTLPPPPVSAASPPSSQPVLSRLLTLAEAPLQHARQLLLLSVFSFRLLEWWHAPQHAAPPPPRLIPPPPPPPPPLSSVAPLVPGVCGACRMLPRDPTAAPSGYVFCASCAKMAATRDGRCPVTGMPMRADTLRRIYETSAPPATGGG